MKRFIIIAALAAAVTPTIASAQYYDNYNYQSRPHDRYGYNHRDDDRRDHLRNYHHRGCRDGSTGTILGAIAGGLLGRTVDRHGDRTAGTVLGAGGGALAGRAIDRNCR